VITATYVVLVLAGIGFGARMVAGPTMADRIVAVNGIVVVGMSAIVAHAVHTENGAFLPVIVVLALVGFVGTGIVARYIEGRGR
jgi:multisubunit Na+/H+ antiporter MnhF subunit